jgi:hypothetical protein
MRLENSGRGKEKENKIIALCSRDVSIRVTIRGLSIHGDVCSSRPGFVRVSRREGSYTET